MLAGSIADSKLLQITTAGKASAVTGTLFHIRKNMQHLLFPTVSTIAGMSITSTSLCWCFNWNASTATAFSSR
jgi:hypothetical protein